MPDLGLSDIFPKRSRSFPLFWIFGSIGGAGFVFIGGYIIHGYAGLNPHEREGGMLAAGMMIMILGLLLLAGVIYTLMCSDDLSFKVYIDQVQDRIQYDPNILVNFIEISRNNVLMFITGEGLMRVFGCNGKLITEIFIDTKDGFSTYHLSDPSVTDEAPVIVGNVFQERFPVRKNRIVNREQAVMAIEKLYSSRSLTEVALSLPFVDTTEETRRLIEKDAYIIPAVPLAIPKKRKDLDRVVKEKEEREKRAIQVLNGTD